MTQKIFRAGTNAFQGGGVDFFQENYEYSLKQDSYSFSEAILFLFITFIMKCNGCETDSVYILF